jgi:hypothetical protein
MKKLLPMSAFIKDFLILCASILFVCTQLIGQKDAPVLTQRASLDVQDVTLSQLLDDIKSQADVRFFYKASDHSDHKFSFTAKEETLTSILDQVLAPLNYSYLVYKDDDVVIVPSYLATNEFSASYFKLLEENQNEEQEGTRSRRDLVVGEIENLKPSGRALVTGAVRDADTNERIFGATIQWLNTTSSDVTDLKGTFNTEVEVGEQIIQVQFIGYQTLTEKVTVLSDGDIRLKLFKEAISLEEIVISERSANDQVQNTQISVERLTVAEIEKLPSFLGEPNVIQSLLIQPGVSSVGEGSIGFNVRGGDVDQNLIVQDDAMIFNTSHALGFFSTFNTDLIKAVDLYKGIMPAEFGGRLASVLDVEMRDGDFDDFKLNAGIGAVSGKVALEGPIKKGKTSFITGFRTSYSDWVLGITSVPEVQNSSASFLDWNGRITHRISDKSSLILSAYVANDNFVFNNDFGFDYSTRLGQVIYKNAFGPKLFSQTTLSISDYSSIQNDFDPITASDFENKITYGKFKEKIDYTVNDDLEFTTGFSGILYISDPGRRIPTLESAESLAAELEQERGLEASIFGDVNYTLSDKFSISVGLRISSFHNFGPAEVFEYDGERLVENIVDTLSFDGGIFDSFYGIEPRASFRYSLDDSRSIKAGYSRTTQYINQIFNTDSPTPTSQWQLSNRHILPTRSHNVSLGYFQNFADNNVEASVSVFARQIDQLFDYRDFANLLVNDHLETELLDGEGRAYGLEFSLTKKTGVINGTFAYTFSRSQRLVEGINRGEWYSSNFDKPHEASLVLNYQPNQRNSVAINMTYASGRPTTPPVAGFVTPQNAFVPIFAERNQRRIPDFRRIDVSYTLGEDYKKDKNFRLSWTFSIYNVLGRENAFSVFFNRGAFNLPRAQQLAILGNAFPSITFHLELL